MTNADLRAWVEERRANAERIATRKQGADRDGWLEDARYYAAILAALPQTPPPKNSSEKP